MEDGVPEKGSQLCRESQICYNFFGFSPQITAVKTVIKKAAQTDFPVLIQGESGCCLRIYHSLKRADLLTLELRPCLGIPQEIRVKIVWLKKQGYGAPRLAGVEFLSAARRN